MWAMLTGSFLASRGAIFPALALCGFSKEEIKRTWGAFCYGGWSVTRLVSAWREHVTAEGEWREHSHEGYRVVAVDMTGFYRPRLQGWLGKAYNNLSGKAVKGLGFGLVADIGSVGRQRLALPRKLLRAHNEQGSEKGLKKRLLVWLAHHLGAKDIAIFDAGFKVRELQGAGVERFVVRQARNCTARRNELPPYKGRGARPKYGCLVRPLARRRKGNSLDATQPDETSLFELDGRVIRVQCWHKLVRPDQTPSEANETFSLMVFYDPLYKQPLVLAINLPLQPESVFELYRDRWPVEQLPLAAKQMLGATRAFVFNPEAVFRLPELALLTGNILSYLAATMPAIPSGFWDTRPKKHQVVYAGH